MKIFITFFFIISTITILGLNLNISNKYIASYHYNKKDFKKSAFYYNKYFENIIIPQRKHFDELLNAAYSHLSINNFNKSEEFIIILRLKFPLNVDVKVLESHYFFKTKNYKFCFISLKGALDLTTNPETIYFKYGLYYYELNNAIKSIYFLEKCISLSKNPEYENLYLEVNLSLNKLDFINNYLSTKEGIDNNTLKKIIIANIIASNLIIASDQILKLKKNENYYYLKGKLFFKKNLIKKAIVNFKLALQINETKQVRYELMSAYLLNKNFKFAEKE